MNLTRRNSNKRLQFRTHEYKIMRLRETTQAMPMNGTNPAEVAAYWNQVVTSAESFNPECECLVVLLLDTRYRIKGHHLVSIGTLTTVLSHPREIFRVAIIASAFAIVLAHNHPSGDASPSADDIQATKDIARAGDYVGIPVVDHIIVAIGTYYSCKQHGVF